MTTRERADIEVRREGWGPVETELDAPHGHRKRHGLFFTPWPIALALGRRVCRHLEAGRVQPPEVCDPFVGAGVLLAALVEAYVEPVAASERAKAREAALRRTYGTDLEAAALEAATTTLGGAPLGAASRLVAIDTLLNPARGDLAGPSAWEAAFAPVFARGGFDVVVANPPWEKVRVNDREFFGRFEEGFARLPRARRDQRRRELLARATVAEAYAAYQRRVAALKAAAARDYVTAGSGGDLDTYKLAVERCVDLVRPGGLIGLIVPHGLLGDWGARGLRRWLLDEHTVLEIVRLETGPELFPEIHANLGVVLAVVRRGRHAGPTSIAISQAVRSAAELEAPRFTEVASARVAGLTEHTMVPLVEGPDDLAFLEACARWPALAEWPDARFKPRRELDMTNDRHRFCAVGEGAPLLEGKHLAPWRLDGAARRFDVVGDEVERESTPRIAWRAVADRAMKRRLVAAWVPEGVALGNSLIYTLGAGQRGVDDLLWLLAWMNGPIAERQLRLWCANNNINMFHLLACRAPLPEDCAQAEELVGLAAASTCLAMREAAPPEVRARARTVEVASGQVAARIARLWGVVYGVG